MAKVELKKPIVDEIAENIKDAQSVVLVDYRGLTVEQDTNLRKQLREAGVQYKVYKNTLIKRAAEGTDFAQLDSVLEGPTAIAVSKDDPAAAARIIAKFAIGDWIDPSSFERSSSLEGMVAIDPIPLAS